MYQKVKAAWVVLDLNNYSRLSILFEEKPVESEVHAGYTAMDSSMPYCEVFDNGIVKRAKYNSINCGSYDSIKYITKDGTKVETVAVDVVIPGEPGYHQYLITKDFANHILKEFNLPFHLVPSRREYADGMNLLQDDTIDLIGTMAESKSYGQVTISAVTIGDANGVGDQEWFVCETSEGTRYLMFDDLMTIYKGIDRKTFNAELAAVMAQ